MEFDNSEDLRMAPPDVQEAKKQEMLGLFKNIQKFVSAPPKNDIAKQWIGNELNKKDTLPIPKDQEVTPHPDSKAAEEAQRVGLTYFGFGRYGKNGKVTHRSVHDKLVDVTTIKPPADPKIPVSTSQSDSKPKEKAIPGYEMKKLGDKTIHVKMNKNKQSINEDYDMDDLFELDEDLRNWFKPDHPEGGWKRINSKGEAIGPCAREPGEPKPKCMSNEKRAQLSKKERANAVRLKRKHDPNPERKGAPINVSNYGKGKISEETKPKQNYLKDGTGKVRVFMLRRAAAKEAHQRNGEIEKHNNGYVVKLKEEYIHVIQNSSIVQEATNRGATSTSSVGWSNQESNSYTRASTSTRGTEGRIAISEVRAVSTKSCGHTGTCSCGEGGSGSGRSTKEETKKKISLSEIRSKKEKVKESIDKGIEPGLSMASSGESIARDTGEKIKKYTGKATQVRETIGDGGEMINSMAAQKEDELSKIGIKLKSFKTKKYL
jgi:hypothetical protein